MRRDDDETREGRSFGEGGRFAALGEEGGKARAPARETGGCGSGGTEKGGENSDSREAERRAARGGRRWELSPPTAGEDEEEGAGREREEEGGSRERSAWRRWCRRHRRTKEERARVEKLTDLHKRGELVAEQRQFVEARRVVSRWKDEVERRARREEAQVEAKRRWVVRERAWASAVMQRWREERACCRKATEDEAVGREWRRQRPQRRGARSSSMLSSSWWVWRRWSLLQVVGAVTVEAKYEEGAIRGWERLSAAARRRVERAERASRCEVAVQRWESATAPPPWKGAVWELGEDRAAQDARRRGWARLLTTAEQCAKVGALREAGAAEEAGAAFEQVAVAPAPLVHRADKRHRSAPVPPEGAGEGEDGGDDSEVVGNGLELADRPPGVGVGVGGGAGEAEAAQVEGRAPSAEGAVRAGGGAAPRKRRGKPGQWRRPRARREGSWRELKELLERRLTEMETRMHHEEAKARHGFRVFLRQQRRLRDEQASQGQAAAVAGRQRAYQQFHSTMVKVQVVGGAEAAHWALADGGAFAGFVASQRVRHLPREEHPSRPAGTARTASGAPLGHSEGMVTVPISLPESSHPHLVMKYEMESIANEDVPTILGVDLFRELRAKFDYEAKLLTLNLLEDGEPVRVTVPFTVGDEEQEDSGRELVDTVATAQHDLVLCAGRQDGAPPEVHWLPCEVAAAPGELRRHRTYMVTGSSGTMVGATGRAVTQGGEEQEISAVFNHLTHLHLEEGAERAVVLVPVQNMGEEDLILRAGAVVASVQELKGGEEDEVEVDIEQLAAAMRLPGGEQAALRQRVAAAVKGPRVQRLVGLISDALAAEAEEDRDEDGMRRGDDRCEKSGRELVEAVDEESPAFREWEAQWEEQVRVGEDASEERRRQIVKLLYVFQEVIAENPKAPPAMRGVEHEINMTPDWDGEPRRVRLRPHSPKEFEAVRETAESLLKGGIVRHSTSPWSCQVVLVPKADGSLRTCCDFRALNQLSRADRHNIPRIDDVLDKLRNATEVSALDMASGYWAVPLREEDREKTAFLTWSHGLLEWVRMPMGLRNSGATYQRMLQQVLGPLLWESSMNYLDDVSIFSNAESDHIDDLARVLKRLTRWGITVKLSKCLFCGKEMPYLGFMVRVGEGITVDLDKIKSILSARAPETVTQVRGFIGAMNFYAKFIPNFAALADQVRSVIKGKTKRMSVKAEWDADPMCEAAFRALKAALASAPILVFPDFSKPFTVVSDVSKSARQVGGVLVQYDSDGIERPVAYMSKQLTDCEMKYTIQDLECLALVIAFRKFRKYLHGSPHPIMAISDHKALRTLHTRPDPHGRLARYALELSELDHVVYHRPGKENMLADFCSRAGWEEHSAAELEEMVDAALTDRFETLRRAVERGPVSAEEMKAMFSEENRQLRLQLMLRGAAAEDGVIDTVRQVSEVLRLRAQEAETLREMSGEWFLQAETMDMVAGVQPEVTTTGLVPQPPSPRGCDQCWRAEVRTTADREAHEKLGMMEKPPHRHCHRCGAVARQEPGGGCSACGEEKVTEAERLQWVMREANTQLEAEGGADVEWESEGEGQLQWAAALTRAAAREALQQEREAQAVGRDPARLGARAEVREAQRSRPVVQGLETDAVWVPVVEVAAESREDARALQPSSTAGGGRGESRLVEAAGASALVVGGAEWKHALGRAQDEEAFSAAMKNYLRKNEEPPSDPYMRDRVLKVADVFMLDEDGLLHREWHRDPRPHSKIEPVLQAYVPEALRGKVLVSNHGGDRVGHLSAWKTYQRTRSKWWWPGMFSDTYAHVRSCGICQTRGRKPPKQAIQGHVRSDRPGAVWMLDGLHMPESTAGHKYVLTMVDVATRWAFFVPLKRLDSVSVMKAVVDKLYAAGASPELFITDNGSEFKKTFATFCALLSVQVRKSVPHHAEGHGLVEAANRTISDIVGHMCDEDGGEWDENLPWAQRAYLSAPHTALGDVLSPYEATMGRSMRLPLDPDTLVELSEGAPDRAAQKQLLTKIGKALEWVREERVGYERAMVDTKRNRGRRKRRFHIGDKVRLYSPPKNKTQRKLGRVFVGPFVVVECIYHNGEPSEYVLRREGGGEGRVRATVERLRPYVDAHAMSSAFTAEQLREVASQALGHQWEVRTILDERGAVDEGTKEYLVDWVGDWEPTWEPEVLVAAPALVTEFHTRKHQRDLQLTASVRQRNDPTAWQPGDSAPTAVTLTTDLLSGSPQQVWSRILSEAGVGWAEVMLVWSSPPCRTFSPADYSNITRNNNFRDPTDPMRGPTVTNPQKAAMAREHDRLVLKIWDLYAYAEAHAPRVRGMMENPQGLLARRDYMQTLPEGWRRDLVDQCSFGRDYKKSTHLWHNFRGLQLRGRTGDGLCHALCGKGRFENGYFKHFKAIAMEPIRGPRGAGHTKEKNALPAELLEEVLVQAKRERGEVGADVIIDLCAGFQSWRPVAAKHGFRYVAVDVMGDRNLPRTRKATCV